MGTKEVVLSKACRETGLSFEERADGRFCQSCQKMQYDFRASTRRQVLRVMEEHGGRVCGRLRAGPGGKPRFVPEPPRRGLAARGAAIALALAACDSPAEEIERTSMPVTDDGIVDHSADLSTTLADHAHHAHRHDPVTIDVPGPDDYEIEGEVAFESDVVPDPPPTTTTTTPPPSTAPLPPSTVTPHG